MKEQKNIERLFQEKFKDFEAIPPEDTWDKITLRLNEKKKKKRVIPFWFQLSGIAASLVVIGSLIWNYQNQNTMLTPINNVTVTEDTNIKTNNDLIDSNTTNEVITDVDKNQDNAIENDINSIDKNKKQYKINRVLKLTNNLVLQNKENKKTNEARKNTENSNLNKIVYSNQNSISNKDINDAKNILIQSKENLIQENSNNSKDKGLADNQKEATAAFKNNSKSNSNYNGSLIEKDNEQTKYTNNITTDLKEKNRIKSIINPSEISFNDSTLVAKIAKEPNPLEEMLLAKENGKNETEKEKRNKWAVSTNASPVYFNSVTNRSSIDSKLNANEKNFNNTVSFGLGINYAITKKISIKTGLNNLKIDYNTNDIAFYQDPNATLLKNLEANPMGKMINIESKLVDNGNFVTVLGTPLIKYDAVLKQQINFVEIPVELSYKIIDKKFGIELIGGMSTLFLTENNVSLVSAGQEMTIGKANNLNEIHFSSNVGLGFKYNFWGNFNANFQPMFKYQINTFNDDFRDFKPYFIGLYSGISFSF